MSLSLVAKRPIKSHSNEKIVQDAKILYWTLPFWLSDWRTKQQWYNTKNSRNTIAVAAAVHKDQ